MKRRYVGIYNPLGVHLICVHKIWAVGCDKRFMWVVINGVELCFRIPDDTYKYLKKLGVRTAQSFRKKIDKNG